MRVLKRFSRQSKGEIALHLFVSLIFLLIAASYVYILVWCVLAGFKTHNEIVLQPFALPESWQWENYAQVWQTLKVGDNNFWNMLFNSVYFSLFHTFLSQFMAMNFAYCCTKYKFPGSNLAYTVILIMITLPIYGSAGASYKLMHNLGLVDNYAFILTSAGGYSINYLYYRAFFKNLSWSYAEAAMMDGANEFQIYFRVMVPMSKSIFGALFLTNWLTTWNSYDSAMIYHPNLPTLPVGIYQFNTEMLYRARLDILFAGCVLISIPALVLFIAFNKLITTNVSLGGLKG